ncbi:acetyltransferase [Paenibacillus cisolokensis]|uniref:Acetyltransferase EpsM n=1 Tax=Paenibacillus cisolokensis TaxID=1658519 RepID=A0ABQ4N2Z6_9BACL|nr:acetyltransferase [Paenibacillus cisolokensis]GIQ62540.1 putative acetyltransferase EpsM [Paenibacillus cisolokensis]
MTARPLIVVGDGGHGRVVREVMRASGSHRLLAVVDDRYTEAGERDGVYYGPLLLLRTLLADRADAEWIVAVGDNAARRALVERIGMGEERCASLVHPAACIAPGVPVGPGAVVMPGAVANPGARIGAHAIVNSGAVVEHDAELGPFAHLSPNAALAGGTVADEGAHIGIGASVIPGVRIGRWSVLGAGAAAIRDVPDGVVAAGVPARTIRRLAELPPPYAPQPAGGGR